MDNDNEVMIVENKEAKIHQEVMLFLGDELTTIHKTTGGQVYEIEKEFEKTKKHKSPFVVIILGACLIFVIGIAFTMHKVISMQNQEISVSLEEFNDLNLRALLDTVASAQTNYDNAVKNRAQIQAELESRLRTAEETLKNDIYVIDSMNLKRKTVYNDRVALAKKKYEDSVKSIQNEFADAIIKAENEVQAYKAQLAEFDSAKVESAKNQEKALDSERQLRELETKKLTDRYESRIAELEEKLRLQQMRNSEEMRNAVAQVSKQYQHEIDLLDPTIKDDTARDIIQEAANIEVPDFNGAATLLQNSIASEKVGSFVNKYQEIYDDFRYLDDVVASIPQKNSIPKYVSSARILVNDMSKAFVDTTISFYTETVKLNGTIDGLNNQIKALNTAHENEINNQREIYESTMSNVLALAKTNAIIFEGSTYDDIKIFIAKGARYLLDEVSDEEGRAAEIRIGKVAYKGRIFKAENETFRFEFDVDKDGNLPEVDFSLLEKGSPVKIFSK